MPEVKMPLEGPKHVSRPKMSPKGLKAHAGGSLAKITAPSFRRGNDITMHQMDRNPPAEAVASPFHLGNWLASDGIPPSRPPRGVLRHPVNDGAYVIESHRGTAIGRSVPARRPDDANDLPMKAFRG